MSGTPHYLVLGDPDSATPHVERCDCHIGVDHDGEGRTGPEFIDDPLMIFLREQGLAE